MLDDDEVERYARQIVIPGVGAAGQQQLLASTVLVVGVRRGCRQAALYLRAAGARVVAWSEVAAGESFDVAVVAGIDALDDSTRARLLASGRSVVWYQIGDGGFVAGVHPAAALPAPDAGRRDRSETEDPLHDVAACDAASVACAVVAGLPRQDGPVRFEI